MVVVLAFPAQVILILCALLSLQGHRQITFCLRITQLNLIADQILGKQPAGQHFLGIFLVEDTDVRALADHLRFFRIKLGNRHHLHAERDNLFLMNIQHRGFASHPGSAGSGVDRKDALPGIQEVARVAADGEGGESPALRVGINLLQQALCGIVEDQHIPVFRGIRRVKLFEHGDHHIVRALVDKGNHDLLAIDFERAVLILLHGLFADFPDEIPCDHIRQFISQLFHHVLVHIQCFRGTHIRQGIIVLIQHTFLQEFRNDLLLFRGIETNLASAEPVPAVAHPVIQRQHHVLARLVGRDMVRIGNAYVGCGFGGDICDHVREDPAVIRVQAQVDLHVRIHLFEVFDRFGIDGCLHLVGVILSPENQLYRLRVIKNLRDLSASRARRFPALQPPMTSAQKPQGSNQHQPDHYPLNLLSCHFSVPRPVNTLILHSALG